MEWPSSWGGSEAALVHSLSTASAWFIDDTVGYREPRLWKTARHDRQAKIQPDHSRKKNARRGFPQRAQLVNFYFPNSRIGAISQDLIGPDRLIDRRIGE